LFGGLKCGACLFGVRKAFYISVIERVKRKRVRQMAALSSTMVYLAHVATKLRDK
jgi:hypothetical protein